MVSVHDLVTDCETVSDCGLVRSEDLNWVPN